MSGVADPTERDLAAVAAALLDAGRGIDRLSRPITAAALIALLLLPAIPRTPWLGSVLGTVAVLGLVELYLAIRTGFDAALFHRLASATDPPDCSRLDLSLSRLGLIPPAKTGRPMTERVAGARRLLFWQGLVLGAQALLIAIGTGIALLPVRSG